MTLSLKKKHQPGSKNSSTNNHLEFYIYPTGPTDDKIVGCRLRIKMDQSARHTLSEKPIPTEEPPAK